MDNMNNLRNKVQLIGHLGMNPEVRTTVSGRTLARLQVATTESYKNGKGEWIKNTLWHSVSAWGKTAEMAEANLHKGAEVQVEGKLIHREYIDKTGVKKYITEVQATELQAIPKVSKAQ